jgi:hypothetical protein
VFSFVIVVFVGGVERREILGDDLGGVSCGIDGCAWRGNGCSSRTPFE